MPELHVWFLSDALVLPYSTPKVSWKPGISIMPLNDLQLKVEVHYKYVNRMHLSLGFKLRYIMKFTGIATTPIAVEANGL